MDVMQVMRRATRLHFKTIDEEIITTIIFDTLDEGIITAMKSDVPLWRSLLKDHVRTTSVLPSPHILSRKWFERLGAISKNKMADVGGAVGYSGNILNINRAIDQALEARVYKKSHVLQNMIAHEQPESGSL